MQMSLCPSSDSGFKLHPLYMVEALKWSLLPRITLTHIKPALIQDLNRPLTTYIHSSFNGQSVLNLMDVVKAEMLPLI